MNELNIDALHKVPEILDKRGSYGRQFGKTTYCLYTILGHLQVLENSGISVLISNHKQIPIYFKFLDKIFHENNLEPVYSIPARRIKFKNNSNQIKIWTLESIQHTHPMDLVLKIEDWDNYLITDLEEMPPEFYQEEITINNCGILNKYLRN